MSRPHRVIEPLASGCDKRLTYERTWSATDFASSSRALTQGQSTLSAVTSQPVLSALRKQVEDEYRARTPRSRALHAEARSYLPGGDTRHGTLFSPYPTYTRHHAHARAHVL